MNFFGSTTRPLVMNYYCGSVGFCTNRMTIRGSRSISDITVIIRRRRSRNIGAAAAAAGGAAAAAAPTTAVVKRDFSWSVESSSWLLSQSQLQPHRGKEPRGQFQPLLWRRNYLQQQHRQQQENEGLAALTHPTKVTMMRRKMSTRTSKAKVEGPMKKKKKKTIFFQSLGCPRNFVDSEVMLGLAMQHGEMDVTDDAESADVVVVNTCGFLKSARQESKDTIQQLSNYKQQQQQQQLVVAGCMVNHYSTKETLLEEFPEVDAVLGSGEVDQIVKTLHNLDGRHPRQQQPNRKKKDNHHSGNKNNNKNNKKNTEVHTNTQQGRFQRKSFLEQGDTPRFLATPPHFAYLKIAEGCRKRCAFCIIPTLKGKLQSKPIHQVVDEFNAILQHGTAHEVILIAQDLGDYGKDFEKKKTTVRNHGSDYGDGDNDGSSNKAMKKNESHLTELLHGLLESMDENQMHDSNDDSTRFWLRLLYLYPDEITPDLIDLMKRDKRIARYVDMPIQHINSDMLKRMRRKTTGDDIKATIDLLREKLPDITIRTSLMVGFPGETESHFEELVDFVKTYKLDHVGVFMYENEEGAVSSRMEDQVPSGVKEDRYRRLMEAQWTVVQAKHEKRVQNRERLVIVVEGLAEIEDTGDDENEDEEESGGVRVVGRHVGQCPDIDGQVILEVDEDDVDHVNLYAGERCWVEVVGYDGYDVIGRVVPNKSSPSSLRKTQKPTSTKGRRRRR